MAYELFKRTLVRVEVPTLAIVPDGRIAVNSAACRILLQAGIKSVLLLWDSANSKIAIRAASKSDKNAYAVSISSTHSGVIRAKGFITHIGWNAPSREMIPAVWNERERMFEATLPQRFLASEAADAPKTPSEKGSALSDQIEQVRKEEQRRGRRPIDSATLEERNRLRAALREIVNYGMIEDLEAAMQEYGISPDSPQWNEVLQIWNDERESH